MNPKLIASAVVVVFPLTAIAVVLVVTWTPPAHAVRAPGATAVQAHLATGSVRIRALLPAPTTSLDKLRCDAWQARPSQPCPDAATLAQQMWPSLTQTPKTLYVALSSDSVLSGPSEGINVEYTAADRTLTIHLYASQALYVSRTADVTLGARRAPEILLLVVDTARISAGEVTVWADGWTERLTGDEKTNQGILGTVAV